MSDSLIMLLMVALLVFWTVGAYNRLVRLRSQALQAFGALAVQLRRHIALAQSSAAAATKATQAPGTAPAGLEAAATQCLASLNAAKAKPLDPESIAALAAARGILVMAWQRLASAPHDLGGAPLPESLRAEWDHLVLQVMGAVEEFNQSVQRYNAAVGQFPALLLAWLFGFRAARPL
ncbi:MAG TPA: LemA family protein [Burkholderiaceae bacterium]|nr:LemA family protein [Burkholderiaceae bacterium]